MTEAEVAEKQVVVIGGGPAGLTAGYELTKFDLRPVVLEKGSLVGGLARTESYKGFHFDMGGHRFFTKVEEVKKMWQDVLGGEFLRRPRMSRIFYNGRFFFYPSRRSTRCGPGLAERCHRAQLHPVAALPVSERGHVRTVGDEPVRQAPLPDLLQDLHRKGLGNLVLRAESRMGGPADQGSVLEDGAGEHLRQAEEHRQDAHRGVRLSALGRG